MSIKWLVPNALALASLPMRGSTREKYKQTCKPPKVGHWMGLSSTNSDNFFRGLCFIKAPLRAPPAGGLAQPQLGLANPGVTSCGLTKHLDVSFALSFVLGQRKHPSTKPIARQAASFVPVRVSQGLLAKEHLLPTQPIGLPHGLGSPTLGNVIFQHACMQRALAKTTPQGPSLASLEQGHRSVRLPQPPFRKQRAMGSPGI